MKNNEAVKIYEELMNKHDGMPLSMFANFMAETRDRAITPIDSKFCMKVQAIDPDSKAGVLYTPGHVKLVHVNETYSNNKESSIKIFFIDDFKHFLN